MIAGIDFKIYHDFEQYLNTNDEETYGDAIKVLNEMLAELVKKNKLTFHYGRRKVKILLPVEENHCGNIFSVRCGDSANYWADIGIRCEIDCDYNDFKWDKLVVGVCPDNFIPTARFSY